MELSLSEITELAKKTFGEDVEIDYTEYEGWVIRTKIEEKFDPASVAGTPAEEMLEFESSYGTQLERWMWKNSIGSGSMALGAQAYNEWQEESLKASVAQVRDWVERGISFDWEGGNEYRDNILRIAEERGL